MTDTHPLIYFFCDGGKRLGSKAKKAFKEAVSNSSTLIFVPTPVLWEVSMLNESGDIKLAMPFSAWVDALFAYTMINPWPFDSDTIKLFHEVQFHNDPFDRAIVATALQLGMPLISNDGKMHEFMPCELLWD
ncbi:hypothetical protein BH11CYA1_BH11CYA1_00350 [soil metagenome]